MFRLEIYLESKYDLNQITYFVTKKSYGIISYDGYSIKREELSFGKRI